MDVFRIRQLFRVGLFSMRRNVNSHRKFRSTAYMNELVLNFIDMILVSNITSGLQQACAVYSHFSARNLHPLSTLQNIQMCSQAILDVHCYEVKF